MAAVSINITNNGVGNPTEAGVSASSAGRLVEFSFSLPQFPMREQENPQAVLQQSPVPSG